MASNRTHQGPKTDHFDGQRFFNPGQPPTDRGLADILRWRFQGHREPWDEKLAAAVIRPAARVEGLAITMIGHASFLIQTAGLNILVDPVWSDRASPLARLGPQRYDPPGVAWENLPPIDVVLITHSHYDHLDAATLARLHAAHHPRVIAPLGNDAVIAKAAPGVKAETGDWGQRFTLAPTVAVTLHPAFHWSARGIGDRRMALWCGFVLETPSGLVYIVGDTGYGDGTPFRAVRDRFGPPDVALIPIGAYEPRWFMASQHVDPQEAVRIMRDCGARQALGVHWGTFRLTDEARAAPARALQAALEAQAIDPDRFRALRPGDVWTPE